MPRAIKVRALSWRWLTALAVGASFAMTPVKAAVVFLDKIDGETGGTTLSHNAYARSDVLNGSVDLPAQPNGYGFGCLGGTGKCVNLDGSSGDAGDLRSQVVVGPGSYEFEFWIAGSQRGSTADSLTIRYGDLGETFVLTAGDPYTRVARIVTVGGAGDRILFSPAANDNDDVRVLLDNMVARDVMVMREVDTRLLLFGGVGILVLIVAPQRFGSASQQRRRYRRLPKRA